MKVNLTETTTISASIDWNELKKMIIKNMREGRGYPLSEIKDADIDISIEQETEGSPHYDVRRWNVKIKAQIIQPQTEIVKVSSGKDQ